MKKVLYVHGGLSKLSPELVQNLNFLYNKFNMKGLKKERDTIYLTHSSELLIWLIAVLVIVSISTAIFFKQTKEDNDYNIFMPDVDGLIVGSPVRMMGIEVGHVTSIKPTNEEVFVKFLITDKNVTIPQGTKATVEFSGMAGSKSLELYLPDKSTYVDKTTPILTVNPPKRLHDAAGLLNEMFDKLASIIYTSSSFGGKIKFINIKTDSDANVEHFLDYADNLVDDANKKAEGLKKKLAKNNKNTEGVQNYGE